MERRTPAPKRRPLGFIEPCIPTIAHKPVGLRSAAAPAVSAVLQKGAASAPAIGRTSYFSLWAPSCDVNHRGRFRMAGLEPQTLVASRSLVQGPHAPLSGKRYLRGGPPPHHSTAVIRTAHAVLLNLPSAVARSDEPGRQRFCCGTTTYAIS
jgi:hypothetical protein